MNVFKRIANAVQNKPNPLPELDVQCYNCQGSGKSYPNPSALKCDVCGGSGRQFTKAGVELFNFISRHRGWIMDSLQKP